MNMNLTDKIKNLLNNKYPNLQFIYSTLSGGSNSYVNSYNASNISNSNYSNSNANNYNNVNNVNNYNNVNDANNNSHNNEGNDGNIEKKYIKTKKGKRKIYTGKKGGKYYIKNNKKVYIKKSSK